MVILFEVFTLIFFFVLPCYLFISAINKQKKLELNEQEKIADLVNNGLCVEAKVVDILMFSEMDHNPDASSTEKLRRYLYPVLEFYDNSVLVQKIYDFNYAKNNFEYLKTLKIGDRLEIYYKKSDIYYEQLNFDKKIFLGRSYNMLRKLDLFKEQKKFFYIMNNHHLSLNSEKFNDNIDNYSQTNILPGEIYISRKLN